MDWSFEKAEKIANSFQTPLHRSFQQTCKYALELRAKLEKAELALQKIHDYRSNKPDWNMVMAIAGDYLKPMGAIPSGEKK